MESRIHRKNKTTVASRPKLFLKLGAAPTINRGAVQIASALVQRLNGAISSGNAVLPKNFALSQNLFEAFIGDFAMPQNCLASLQSGFALLQTRRGAVLNRCGNFKNPIIR
jgi:hypothetical protein